MSNRIINFAPPGSIAMNSIYIQLANSGVIANVFSWSELDIGHSVPSPNINADLAISDRERVFLEQKEAYEDIPPLGKIRYKGQYVVSQNGQIVDHDADLVALTRRFFGQFGEHTAVYITRVGGGTPEVFDTPFFD